jgi:hypothetical protein
MAVQRRLNSAIGAGLVVDGQGIDHRYLDGVVSSDGSGGGHG